VTANKILEMESDNPKGAYRKALALKELFEYEPASNFINTFLEEHGKSVAPDLLADLQKLQGQIGQVFSQYQVKQKKVFAKMFE
jgi:hypothetical protein